MLVNLLQEANLTGFGGSGNVIPVFKGGASNKRYEKHETAKRLRAEIRETAEALARLKLEGMQQAEKARALHQLDIQIAAAAREAIPQMRASIGTDARKFAQQAVDQWMYEMHRRRKDDDAMTVLLLH